MEGSKVIRERDRDVGSAGGSNRPQALGNRKEKKAKASGDRLKAKEEEYRRMNAELEAKTSELVKEAEQLLEGNLSIISNLESSNPVESRNALVPADQSAALTKSHDLSPLTIKSRDHIKSSPYLGDHGVSKPHTKKQLKKRPTSSSNMKRPAISAKRPMTTQPRASRAPPSYVSHDPLPVKESHLYSLEPESQLIKSPILELGSNLAKGLSMEPESNLAHEFSLEPEASFGTKWPEVAGEKRGGMGSHMEGALVEKGKGKEKGTSLPPSVDDMGAEATIRFLKAKLQVMQEEMDRLCEEINEKDKLLVAHEGRVKELEATKSKLQSNLQSNTALMEKHKQSAEDLKHRSWGLESQLSAVRKELDALKSSQKRSQSQQSAVEVRLNRALEEGERYKNALQKVKTDARESSKLDRQKLDQLTAENKQLEKQRSELMAAFKKQMKLIDVLKRQKMHIEAAKMLSFTEDEFVKALDWGTN